MKITDALKQAFRVTFAPETPQAEAAPEAPACTATVKRYLAAIRLRNFSPRTVGSYEAILKAVEKALGHPVASATREEIVAYLEDVRARGDAPATVARHLNVLRSFFHWALDEELVEKDPLRTIKPPKFGRHLPIHLNAAQVVALLAAVEGDTFSQRRDALVIKALYFTGMRAGELIGLDWEQVDLVCRSIKVCGKGDKERVLPISDPLFEAFNRWLEVHPTKTGAVVVRSRRPFRRIGYDALRDIVARALGRAGLLGLGFSAHKLRHTFATTLSNQGVRIEEIQLLLGHNDISTTTIYAHTHVSEAARQALKKL